MRFFDAPLDPQVFGRVALLHENDLLQPIPLPVTLEKVRAARRKAKKEVFVTNALRALEQVAPAGNVRMLDHVVLVGGSALDFEVPHPDPPRPSPASASWRVGATSGARKEPRNAVATGLVLSAAAR